MASKNPQVRAIEVEAQRRSMEDGKSSHAERFALRKQLRAEAGLRDEKKKRGGAAGVWDRNKDYIVPIAAGIAGMIPGVNAAVPAILAAGARGLDREGKSGIGFDVKKGAMGAIEGYSAGKIGQFAGGQLGIGAGAVPPVPTPQPVGQLASANAAESGGMVSSMMGQGGLPPLEAPAARAADVMGGAMGRVGAPAAAGSVMAPAAAGGFSGMLRGAASGAMNWLKKPDNLVNLGAGIHGVMQQQKAGNLMDRAVGDDRARWAAGAPLREAGMAGMLNPTAVDTSELSRLSAQGNPFASPAPAPAGQVAAAGLRPAPVGPAPAATPSPVRSARGSAPRQRYT